MTYFDYNRKGAIHMVYGLIIILAYLIGSIPSGLIVGKWFYGIDIRQHGSGNLGGTNTFRTLGKKAGYNCDLSRYFKRHTGYISSVFFRRLYLHPLLIGMFAVIGHMFPIFAGFRGGKAVATSAGILLGYVPFFYLL